MYNHQQAFTTFLRRYSSAEENLSHFSAGVFVRGRALAPCFEEDIRPLTLLAPCAGEGIRPMDEYLPHVLERVFVRGRILAPCVGEGIRPPDE